MDLTTVWNMTKKYDQDKKTSKPNGESCGQQKSEKTYRLFHGLFWIASIDCCWRHGGGMGYSLKGVGFSFGLYSGAMVQSDLSAESGLPIKDIFGV